MKLMSLLRAISLTEGVSYLVLLLVAVPLKYIWGLPLAVKYVGWVHGGLFIALGVLALIAMLMRVISFRIAVILGVAALLPAGPFFADQLLKRRQESLNKAS